MDESQVEQVRRFNRVVTARVGVLHERYLGRGRPIGQARLLWELGDHGRDVRRLRERLGLDSGYLSRLLHALEADGLVSVRHHREDGRVRTVRLTDAGIAEREVLDARSDELAGALLAPLSRSQRVRLVAAMAEVDLLLTAATVTVQPVDPDHPDAQDCLRSYFAELHERFETGFDPARSLLPDAGRLRPPHGLFLLARLHGDPVACAGLKLPPGADTAEIKRMWVAVHARGLGLGRRLISELEAHAAQHGRVAVRLDTSAALTEAIGLYRACGFREVPAFNDEPYAQLWFEKPISSEATRPSNGGPR